MSERNNSNINEGIIDPSVKKPKFVTLSAEDVDNVSIIWKQPEA